jgi:Protein of unknown function (DUF3500)
MIRWSTRIISGRYDFPHRLRRPFMLVTILLAAVISAVPPDAKGYVPPAATQSELVTNMVAAAKALAEVLPAQELKVATFSYGGKEHKFWHYIPTPLLTNPDAVGSTYAPHGRFGVPIEKMSPQAVDRLHALLRTSLSIDGYQRYLQIMRVEGPGQPEFSITGLNRSPTSKPGGGPSWCHFSLFGNIGEGDWGWRFEGHHFSLSMEVSGGQVRFSPVMVGYNPWPQVPTANLRAVSLFESLSKEQQAMAQLVKVSPDSGIPADIERVPGRPQPIGVVLGKLSPVGQYAYNRLVDEFIGQFPDAAVNELRARVQQESESATLAWYGTLDQSKPYFVRLQGKSFLIQIRHNGIEATGFIHGHLSYHALDAGTGSNPLP